MPNTASLGAQQVEANLVDAGSGSSSATGDGYSTRWHRKRMCAGYKCVYVLVMA